jgi:hypothetical protein
MYYCRFLLVHIFAWMGRGLRIRHVALASGGAVVAVGVTRTKSAPCVGPCLPAGCSGRWAKRLLLLQVQFLWGLPRGGKKASGPAWHFVSCPQSVGLDLPKDQASGGTRTKGLFAFQELKFNSHHINVLLNT